MHELRLPLDYERLPEFWQLTDSLRATACDAPKPTPASITQAATFLWLRLWVSLGYLAQSTNRPGYIAGDGLRRLADSLDPLYASDDVVREVLTRGTTPLLVSQGNEFFCPLFARFNEHLAGNFVPGHKRGNLRSRLSAAKPLIAQDALQQAMLLPPETFKHRDGRPMAAATVQRAMVVILTVDRCLKAGSRAPSSYTEGLLADAAAVVEADAGDGLTQFYHWLAENKDHPRVPKTTEEILSDFPALYALAAT